MADQRLEEYRKYYDARAERYANNPNHIHAYEAEKRLRDVFFQYDTFEEIRDHFGTLNIDCAFALWRDQYEMESRFYESIEEPVRKKGADEILAQLPRHTDVTDMSTAINEITNRNSVELSLDEASGKALMDAWERLDAINVLENAEVPDEYKRGMQERADKLRHSICESVQSSEETLGEWMPGFRIKPEIALQPRYRRLLPYSDEDVAQHLQQFKTITYR